MAFPACLFLKRIIEGIAMKKDKKAGCGLNKKRKRWLVPLFFLLPHLTVFSIFNLLPDLAGIYAAFTRWDLGSTPQWIGLQNLKTILFDSSSLFYWDFWWGLQNTVIFVLITVPLRVIIPMLFALILNKKFPGRNLFQVLIYLPALLSLSVVMISWNYMFNSNYGLINTYLHLGSLSWMNTVPFNWIALIIITVWWGTGVNMIVLQSALAGVPQDLMEAAQIDGAGRWKRFFRITLPCIKFPVTYVLTSSLIAEFNVWGQPYMFNNGGPIIDMANGYAHQSNLMLMQVIRDVGFKGSFGSNPGIASAMALVLGAIMVTVSIMQVRMMRKGY